MLRNENPDQDGQAEPWRVHTAPMSEEELAQWKADNAETTRLCREWEEEAREKNLSLVAWQCYMNARLAEHLQKTNPEIGHAFYVRSTPATPEQLERLRKTVLEMQEARAQKGEAPEESGPPECDSPVESPPQPDPPGMLRHAAYMVRPFPER